MFASNRWVAKLCRRVCKVAGFEMPTKYLAELNALLNCRAEIGLIWGLPGNNHPAGCASRQ